MSLSFEEAFHDPLGAWRSLRELVQLWDHDGLCRYRRLRIPITADVQPGKGSNGGAHMQLKLSAAHWLRDRGITDVVMERSYAAGIADVQSPGRRIAFECGWTEPRKLISGEGRGVACIWLPYAVGGWRTGDVADTLLVVVPHARRGEKPRYPIRPIILASDGSSRFLAV